MDQRTEDIYYEELNSKILQLERHIRQLKNQLVVAPKGRIASRNRANGRRYYWIKPSGRLTGPEFIEKDITKDYGAQKDLMDKFYKKELLKRQENNLQVLRITANQYQKISPQDILQGKDENFQQQWKNIMVWKAREDADKIPYPKKAFDETKHIHQVSDGEWVRSKGEVIIYEKLLSKDIPFHYEERFPTRHLDGYWLYPDFKILLPNSECIWWEHCGMMDRKDYCEDLAKRLQHYQKSGVTIGKNLIVTADDTNGSCSGQLIDQTIDFYIAPFLKLPKRI